MPKDTNDQVVIKYGPARYDSPKAIRRNIEAAVQDSKEEIELNIPSIDKVTVESYDPNTGEGTYIDGDGDIGTFDNITSDYLEPGDEVFVFEDSDGEEHVIGSPSSAVSGFDYTPSQKWRPLTYTNISGSNNFVSSTNYGRIFFSLFEVDHQFTLDAFGVVTAGTSATAKLRIGLYDDWDGRPDVLLVDGGQIDCTAAGAKTQTVSSIVLGPGRYWVAVVWQQLSVATLSISGYNIFGGGAYKRYHDSIQHATTAGASNPCFTTSAATYTTGGLPTSTSDGSILATWTTTNGYGYGPAVALRHL